MESWLIGIIVLILIVAIFGWRRELFGESIYLGVESEVRGDSDKRPAIFTSGATQRNLGQDFSSTNQDMNRTY